MVEEGTISEKQLKYIGLLRSKVGSDKFKKVLNEVGLKEDVQLKELTIEEASLLIDRLQESTEGEKGKRMDNYIDFEQLIKKAHQKFKGNFSIETEYIQKIAIDESNKFEEPIVFRAKVIIHKNGKQQVFTAHGDATKNNTTEYMSKHLIRVAETRAIVRALRFALGVGMTAKEEVEE